MAHAINMRKFWIKISVFALLIATLLPAMYLCCGSRFARESATFIAMHQDTTALKDKISSYTTYFYDSPSAREHNIALAALKLNNTALMPSKTLSFNAIVGKRSAERGFMEANIIVDGEFKEGIGGGVCQVSSTLYNAWVTAGLEIVSAKAHSLPVTYIPMSRDATVSSNIDLVLKNSSAYPILITTKCENKSLVVTLYGQSDGYEYNVTTKLIRELIPAPPEIIYDSDKPQDFMEQIKKPRVGYITFATLQTLKDGKVISEKKLREDTYQPIRAKIVRGGVSSDIKQ